MYDTWYSYFVLVPFDSLYFAARFLERFTLSRITDGLVWIGSYWLGAMAYFVIILLAIDVLRIVNFIFHVFPDFITTKFSTCQSVLLLS